MIHDFAPFDDGQVEPRQPDFRGDQERDTPLLSLHNPDSQDSALADRMAREQVRVAGARVKVYARTDNADYDHTFDEDADPTYLPPVQLHCYFKPQPMEMELKRWGIDAANKAEAVFAIGDLKDRFPGRLLRPGDVLELPYNHPVASLNPGFYRILNGSPSGNFRYNWLYFTCQTETLSADHTVRVREDMPADLPDDSGSSYVGP